MTVEDARKPVGLGPWRTDRSGSEPRFPIDAVGRSIGDRFTEVATSFGDNTAVRSPAGAWTYRELLQAVQRRSRGVRQVVGPSSSVPVAILAEHDAPLVITMLSIICAGHVVVVLDPMAPPTHNSAILDESDAPVLICDDATHELAVAVLGEHVGDISLVRMDDLDHGGTDDAFADLSGDAPAMLAFTSGTSGESKGAVITHGVLLNVVRGATTALGIEPTDRMPMLFPVSLAVAAYPLFIPLLNGATLATLDVRSVGLAPIADFLAEERITVAYMAPTVIRFLTDALAGRSFPDLRLVALGGEPVDAEVAQLCVDLFDPEYIANGYGTTETGVVSLYVAKPLELGQDIVPAGYAVQDVDIHIVNEFGEPVAPGESGEIAVASPFMFTGYWGHPDLTARVLLEDPSGRPGWQLYRTGDLGHLDSVGALVVSGRIDTKVKIRGRFVVLGDVEADVRDLASVRDAAVVASTSEGVNELIALVVLDTDATIDATELRAALLERREPYRVPSRWIPVAELPRLPNGKTDRQAVWAQAHDAHLTRSRDTPAPAPAPEPMSSEDDIERRLIELWQRLLPVGRVQLDDDFAHLGGDSLLAAQMLIYVERELGVRVPMGELVQATTVRSLAGVIRRLAISTESGGSVACVQQGDTSTRPKLWLVPDLQGSAYRLRHLAAALGEDQPIWSFESPFLSGEANRFDTLREFAKHLVDQLRLVQPQGPYWLGGYSFGGICAYEMARQLTASGSEVAFVGVVDVGPSYRGPGWDARRSPGRPWFGVAKPPPDGSTPTERMNHYVGMVRASPIGALRHLSVRTGLARLIDPLRFELDLKRHGRVRPEWRLWYAWEQHWKLAAQQWDRSSTYPGRVDLFWEATTTATDDSMGWKPLVGELVIHRFAVAVGDHDAILEPSGAPALAASLRGVLDERSSR